MVFYVWVIHFLSLKWSFNLVNLKKPPSSSINWFLLYILSLNIVFFQKLKCLFFKSLVTYINDFSYFIKLVSSCTFSGSPKFISVWIVCSLKRIAIMIFAFGFWPQSLMEMVWKLFGYSICVSVNSFGIWLISDWSFLSEACFKRSIFSWRCLICFFNSSSSVLLMDELDRDGGFSLWFFMLNAFSCLTFVFGYILVDIFVLFNFGSMFALLHLQKQSFPCFLLLYIFFLNSCSINTLMFRH